MTVSVSAPERTTVPGQVAGGLAVDDGRDAADEHSRHADRAGEEAAGAAGQVVDHLDSPASTDLGVEHDQVGVGAFGDGAAVAQAEQARRAPGSSCCTATLDRGELAAAEAVADEPGGVRRPAHAVEVRAGVGAADHDRGVLPRLAPQLPRLGVAVGGAGPEHRAQVVGDHDVEQRVERRRSPRSAAMSPTTATLQALVGSANVSPMT